MAQRSHKTAKQLLEELSGRRPPANRRGIRIAAAFGSLAAVVLAVLAIVGAAALGESVTKPESVRLIGHFPKAGASLGESDAPVRARLLFDPLEPYTAAFLAGEEMQRVLEESVMNGPARIELLPYSEIGGDSRTASRLILAAAAEDRSWPLALILAADAPDPAGSGWEGGRLVELIEAAGFSNPKALLAASRKPEIGKRLDEITALVDDKNLDSSPSVLVNGPEGAFKLPEHFGAVQLSLALQRAAKR